MLETETISERDRENAYALRNVWIKTFEASTAAAQTVTAMRTALDAARAASKAASAVEAAAWKTYMVLDRLGYSEQATDLRFRIAVSAAANQATTTEGEQI